jgi:predicted cupin superfamily sugar epimerase
MSITKEKVVYKKKLLIFRHNSLIIKYAKVYVNSETKHLIEKLNLSELYEEGGYYRETHRSKKSIIIKSFDNRNDKDNLYRLSEINDDVDSTDTRSVFTLIYYLLDGDQFSAFHKVRFDEIWHFYKGSTVSLYLLTDSKKILSVQLGNNLDNNEQIHYVIKGNTWFAAEINNKSSYSLIGCSVSPGFDFKDFKLGSKSELKKIYPQHEFIIDKLCKQ